jgi:uncharacterized repeat protein (TIGR03803 family)
MWPFSSRKTRTVNASSHRRRTFRPSLESLETRDVPSATTPLINWTTPAPISYGTALGSAQLDASAADPTTGGPLSGSFVYSPGTGAILPSGSTTLTATFTPTDLIDYTTASQSVSLVVTPSFYISTLANLTARSEQAGLIADGSGNFYGTTYSGGAYGYGSIYELAKGSSSVTTLASFNNSNGAYPEGGLVMDGVGNLYGTTFGGSNTTGVVFELAKGSSTITDRGALQISTGYRPEAGVILDASGNLYGTTTQGGANSRGTVFEILKGRNFVTVLASFNGSNGAGSEAGLLLDGNGNLYGTTAVGGASNAGAVFEIVKGSGAITTLASFNGSDGRDPEAGLTMDASGDLYGTTYLGGAYGDGSVFELASGGSTITALASFNGSNGRDPDGRLILDGSGNLFGTTYEGGATGDGAVFELGAGSGAITDLASFGLSNGAYPEAGLTVDGSGNFYGTTYLGTVFELNHFAPGQPPLVVNPASTVSPTIATSASLSVLGNDYYGEASLNYTWAVTSAPAGAATPTLTFASGVSNGTNAAKNATATFSATGVYTFQAALSDPAGLSTVSSVSVTVNQVPWSIGISPANATLAVKSKQQFQAAVLDQFGQPMATQPTAYTWSIVSGVGSISKTGLYTSLKTGSATIQATTNDDFYPGYGGTLSGTASVTVTALPAAPSKLTAAASLLNGIPQVQLQWTNNPTNQTGIVVQRSADGGATWTTLVVLTSNADAYTDTTADQNTTYEYQICAFNALGDSPFSNVATLTAP